MSQRAPPPNSHRKTHIKRVLQIKVVMSVEVTSNKLVDLSLGCLMQVLELVHSLELDDVETVRQDAIRFALQQMFRLVGGDV